VERQIRNELANKNGYRQRDTNRISRKGKPLSVSRTFLPSFELFMAKSFQIDRKTLRILGDIFPTVSVGKSVGKIAAKSTEANSVNSTALG